MTIILTVHYSIINILLLEHKELNSAAKFSRLYICDQFRNFFYMDEKYFSQCTQICRNNTNHLRKNEVIN